MKIAVLVDGSAAGRAAAQRAAGVAASAGAVLTLVHLDAEAAVTPLPPRRAAAQAMLDQLGGRLAAAFAIEVGTALPSGAPLACLHRLAADAALVVVGVQRRSPLRAQVMGVAVEQLLRTCPRPLLVVGVVGGEAEAAYRRVLVAVDFSPSAEAVMQAAADFAPGAAVELLHVVPSGGAEPAVGASAAVGSHGTADYAAVMARLRAFAGRRRVPAPLRCVVAPGCPVGRCLARQREHDAELLVVGRSGESTFAGYLLGAVARRLVAEAPCDLLVVPPPARGRAAAAARVPEAVA